MHDINRNICLKVLQVKPFAAVIYGSQNYFLEHGRSCEIVYFRVLLGGYYGKHFEVAPF